MTDPKKPEEFDQDVDWDQALAEWEDKSFAPEVARDVVTDKPGALAGQSRPLYRPPEVRPAAKPAPSPPVAPTPADFSFADEDNEATLIAAIPEELLRKREENSPRGGSRGGLGQLFSREAPPEPPTTARATEPPATSKGPAIRPKGDAAEEVVTSAKAVPSGAGPLNVEPLRRAPRVDVAEAVPDGALFNPFTEPRPEQLTIPAAEEVTAASLIARQQAREELPRLPSVAPPEDDWDDDDKSTQMRRPSQPPPAPDAGVAPPAAAPLPVPTVPPLPLPALPPLVARRLETGEPRVWPDEKPASAWLDEAARTEMEERCAWLEEEARAVPDKVGRARALLACSELVATLGDRDHAHAIATEARDLAPSLALAHRQARALMPWTSDPDAQLEALEAEVKMTPAGAARVHSNLLAATALRTRGDDEGAAKRLDQTTRTGPADVRSVVDRVTRALGNGETTGPALRVPESPDFVPIAQAIAACLRLRGVGKEGSDAEWSAAEVMLRARQAVTKGDLGGAASILAGLARVGELTQGARWLAAALGATTSATRPMSAQWLRDLRAAGDRDAHRPLLARAIELDDRELVAAAVNGSDELTPADRIVLSALSGLPLAPSDPLLDAASSAVGMAPLVSAVAAAVTAPGPARHPRTAGLGAIRTHVELGRKLAAGASVAEIEATLDALPPEAREEADARGITLELNVRAGRAANVSRAIEAWGGDRFGGPERSVGALAAALIAERGGATARAIEAYRAAYEADPGCEAAVQALASLEAVDPLAEMSALAEHWGDGLRASLARLEAVERGRTELPDATQAQWLEFSHRATPSLPMAAFLAERLARRAGDVEEVLRWVRERRAHEADPIESALDLVREALLVADRDPELASERLREAHAARPSDVALRDLYERMSSSPPDDRAAWRERRALDASGDARALLSLEAAHDYERIGDEESALRCATVAAAQEAPIARVARERAELRSGRVGRLADELLAIAKGAPDTTARREAYERLAVLDATAREDAASALLWHRSVLEEWPHYKPSLRHVEHHLIGEGRHEELEPVAAGIAIALRGTGPGEFTAHAELCARLRFRAESPTSASAREMIELAAGESEPSLWSLRMLEAQARAQHDDATLLSVTKRIVERATRPADTASLLVRAGEAAIRLEQFDEARALLQRATVEDSGDIVAWWLLADLRRRANDARGAAEACEAIARCSGVRQHQLLAWYDAGRLWLDEVNDDERAVGALEAAAAIDVTHKDVFDRLSRLYAARRMQSELAELLERRIERVTDPEERLAIEVRRGRVLLEVGETDGARDAFEAALAERPDDPGALSAFADLCLVQQDWEAAEQALVRLARLYPTPEEQRGVYSRLGDLYSHHLLNLSRAEVALKEVLKRAPDDMATAHKLVDVYKRQNDPARAVELQQELTLRSASPEDKRSGLLELAAIHERVSRDLRRAEKTLEAARRDLPHDVEVLRALADFYVRHHQNPALSMLLDRAAADARRAIEAGRLAPGSFEVLAEVCDLRGRAGAKAATRRMLDAVLSRPVEAAGIGDRAFDPQLDKVTSPGGLTPSIRTLLTKAGSTLEAEPPLDLRELRASPLAAGHPAQLAARFAESLGLRGLQVMSSPSLGSTCVPVASPVALVLGEDVARLGSVAVFLALRALKLLAVRAAALGRVSTNIGPVVSRWLESLEASADHEISAAAAEASATLRGREGSMARNAVSWANRVALLALGDPAAALDAIAATAGLTAGAPKDPSERSVWIARTPEALDLVAFGVSEAFAQALGE